MNAPSHPGLGSDDACPPWCRRDHTAGDHPEDQHHQSPARLVAVVTGQPMLDPDDQAQPVSAVIRLVRRLGSETTWLELLSEEGPEVRLVITTESARRLVRDVHRLLAAAET